MAEFATLRSYSDFERSVKNKARFVHDQNVSDFLTVVLKTSASRRKRISKGKTFFRAQRGFEWRTENSGEEDEFDVETAYSPERMLPVAEYVGDGCANPRGIPCLYMASSPDTAMAEVRPWVGSRISAAEFKMMRDCVVVDCSLDKTRSFAFELDFLLKSTEPDANAKESGVWGDIAYAFSKPVALDESPLDYIPTQVLAEAFHNHGYDGIVYKSLLNEHGRNIALFDMAAAEIINCCLFEVQSVSFKFRPTENPYVIVKHYPQFTKSTDKKSAPETH